MKALFIISAIIEGATGLVLLSWPAIPVFLLAGSTLDAPAGLLMSQVAGCALIALAIACGLSCNANGRRASAVLAAMLVYNGLVAGLIAYSGMALGVDGPLVWPAVVLHTILSAWCGLCAWKNEAIAQTRIN